MDTMYTDGTYLRNNPDWHVDDSPWKANQVSPDAAARMLGGYSLLVLAQ